MNVFLLVVALAAPVGAPKAGLQEAAVASAAVASESVLPEDRAVSAAETTLPCKSATSGGAGVPPAQIVKAAIPQRISAWPEPRADSDCNLAGLYRRRFLSGPWSVKRRLEAARIRGDTEEIERLTAMLEEIVGEALEVEAEQRTQSADAERKVSTESAWLQRPRLEGSSFLRGLRHSSIRSKVRSANRTQTGRFSIPA